MKIYILFGQTATGKSSKALSLCDTENGEIVNFDSRQIYKNLNIVTGKDLPPDAYQPPTTNHFLTKNTCMWLYDIIDPKKTFSSADYAICAEQTIKDILLRGKTPILVGGTGYYLRHLLYGAPEIAVKEDWDLRKHLETKSVEELQIILREKNAPLLTHMNNSDRNNPRRLIRRIEISQSVSELPPIVSQEETLTTRLANLKGLQEGITITYIPFFHPTQEIAREKISLRVEQRITDGALEEGKNLLKDGYSKDDPGLNAIGYQQIIGYLEKRLTLSEMKKQWITKEVQYAKRQKTYFNKYFITNK